VQSGAPSFVDLAFGDSKDPKAKDWIQENQGHGLRYICATMCQDNVGHGLSGCI
jgi:hypothetical protein